MPRIRTIKPDFFTSEAIARISSYRTRLTFIGLWTQVDDEGRMRDRPKLIRAALWPLEESVTDESVEADLAYLAQLGRITRYAAAPRTGGESVALLQITNWLEHQRINRPTPSLYPGPTEPPEPDINGRSVRGVHEDSVSAHGTAVAAAQDGFSEPTVSAPGALTRGGGRGKGSGKGGGHNPAPRPRCRRHAHLPEDDPGPPCVGCRSVRLRHEREAEEAAAEAQRAAQLAQRAAQLAQREVPRPVAGRGRELARSLFPERRNRAVGE